jgi:hypothetical protein
VPWLERDCKNLWGGDALVRRPPWVQLPRGKELFEGLAGRESRPAWSTGCRPAGAVVTNSACRRPRRDSCVEMG